IRLPATPRTADSTGTPATLSASSTAWRIELTVASRLTIRPLRRPFDSAAPSARNLTPSSSSSPIKTQVFVLPMSSPTRYRSFFTAPPLLTGMRGLGGWLRLGGRRLRLRIHHHLACKAQVDRFHKASARVPGADVFDEHAELLYKVVFTKMPEHRALVAHTRGAQAGDLGQHGAQVSTVGKIHLADMVGSARANELDLFQEFDVEPHPLLTNFRRHALPKAGDHGKAELPGERPLEHNAEGIEERQIGAQAEERHRRALDQLHAHAVRQHALDTGLLDPRNLLERAPPLGQRDAQDAAPPVRIEFFEHRGAADVVIADELDLVRSGENHARRIEKEIRGQVDEPSARKDGASRHERAAIERPAPPAKLPAANLQGILPTQVARFFVAQKLRRVAFGLGRHHLSQTITSFSSSRPYVERTRLRTWVISCIISALLARPPLMKKFAWRSLTRASPTPWPLRPSSSIMRPAEAPGGFLKMQPALF